MEFSSEMVCRVALPPSLPPMDHLAKLEGSILLHSAEPTDQGITLEGDLLWRGFFPDDSGVLQCLWEGAEFFRETFSTEGMKRGDDLTISPSVNEVTGTIKDDDTYELRFMVHWWDYHTLEDSDKESMREDTEKEEDEDPLWEDCPCEEKVAVAAEVKENFSEAPAEDEVLTPEDNREEEETMNVKESAEPKKIIDHGDDFEKEIKAIDDTFRETIKVLKEEPSAPKEIAAVNSQTDVLETTNELESQTTAPASKHVEVVQEEPSMRRAPNSSGSYCRRYYRARPGDRLDAIAERLSVSRARMREINELDEIGIVDTKEIENRMIRIE